MSTVRSHYEGDFATSFKMAVVPPGTNADTEIRIHYDFDANASFISCYVAGLTTSLEQLKVLLSNCREGTNVTFAGRIELPAARHVSAEYRIENMTQIEISARFYGDPDEVSFKTIPGTRRFFIYSELQLSDEEIRGLKLHGDTLGMQVQFRSQKYVERRALFSKPLAFISHDSRDKIEIASKIAMRLNQLICPVWYDQYSLKVGQKLRETIEKGLKETKKCVLILSPNFLSNNGWTKREFDAVFTRELLEEKDLILPIWANVTKREVFDYSPNLANVKALIWHEEKLNDICAELYHAIISGGD
jgi:hypothetical protein